MFNKFLFFSFVFLLLSFVVNTVIVYAATEGDTKVKKQKSIKENTTHIQVQQRQIIEHLEDVEKRL
tara:strand:- start:614 stop:811 length:198 start_codon:yes stop_codon:yes gene_type:complete